VNLCIEAPAEQPQVFGHQDQLEQVLINLMVNARDALLEQRRAQPWIRVRQTLQGSRLCLVVEDNGGGIDPHLLERIFEPFFTTKPAGSAPALGCRSAMGSSAIWAAACRWPTATRARVSGWNCRFTAAVEHARCCN
jgi:signal transduction histidine kinase